LGLLRTGGVSRSRLSRCQLMIRGPVSCLDSARSPSLRGVAVVLFPCDCSRTFPSRGTTHTLCEELCLGRQTRMYLVRIPRRKGHSILSNVLAGEESISTQMQHPWSASSWPKREGSQQRTAIGFGAEVDFTSAGKARCQVRSMFSNSAWYQRVTNEHRTPTSRRQSDYRSRAARRALGCVGEGDLRALQLGQTLVKGYPCRAFISSSGGGSRTVGLQVSPNSRVQRRLI
jgi:hypothetical protein